MSKTVTGLTETERESKESEVLRRIEERVLWLSTAMIHHANRVRPNPSGLKVGGHQASSASMASIMTALWFRQLCPQDRVSVKPHASPVLHAINYLLGELDESHLTTLRAFGGLQSYPSRSKDPDPVDYSTGSVGIGATAPCGAPSHVVTWRGTSAGPVQDVSTRSWATPSWMRVQSGRRSRTRRCRAWVRRCGSSTSTGNPSTGSFQASPRTGCRACSPRRAGRSSPQVRAPAAGVVH